jgi:F420H(2)-dependent quinone reductase
MSLNGEYEPSPAKWVRDQVQEYEESGGTSGTTMRDMPVILVTTRGARSGLLRKVPLMRVEHDGEYAAVASKGGAPENPVWYFNLVANPAVEVRDGTVVRAMKAREVTGAEKAVWWKRAVAAFPDYADYQARAEREIPVFVLTPDGPTPERPTPIR